MPTHGQRYLCGEKRQLQKGPLDALYSLSLGGGRPAQDVRSHEKWRQKLCKNNNEQVAKGEAAIENWLDRSVKCVSDQSQRQHQDVGDSHHRLVRLEVADSFALAD